MNQNLLNIGCGRAFHPAWTNIDLVSYSPHVRSHDIREGLPYPDASFDACYTSHLLEHLLPEQAKNLMKEAFRVLKPRGVLRIAVPDLETIVRTYLDALERVEAGEAEAEPDYHWMMLELYDQATRHFSGGEMGKFLNRPNITNREFILARIGCEAEAAWNNAGITLNESIWKRIRSKSLAELVKKAQVRIAKVLVALVAGEEALSAFEVGLFRNSGEIHHWMYDRFSLRRLVEQAGFAQVSIYQANQSHIPNFDVYRLDMVNGKIRKPDSLFVEGIKL